MASGGESLTNPLREGVQDLVAGLPAQNLIEVLKVVDIERRHGNNGIRFAVFPDPLSQVLQEGGPV